MNTSQEKATTPQENFFAMGVPAFLKAVEALGSAISTLAGAVPHDYTDKQPMSCHEWNLLYKKQQALARAAQRLAVRAQKGAK